MSICPCVAERYCKCGSQLHIEYESEGADSAVVQMFDELHHGPDCGPVTPQMAALARSNTTRRELLRRRTPPDTREKGLHVNDRSYDILFPDRTGIRDRVIAGALTALGVPRGTRVRARDAWVELTDEGNAHLRLVCKLGGWNRAPYTDSINTLRGIPGFIDDYDETFNPAYASFCFALPESISPEVRAEMAEQAIPVRDLAVEAAAAHTEFAAMGSRA